MEHMSPRILIVIPLYNHAQSVVAVVKRCLDQHGDVLVVDDGSTDIEDNLFEGLNVSVIRHDTNLGKGKAIMTAARHAGKLGMTHLVTLDADLQHHPENFDRFKQAIEQDPDALFVGKRDFDAAQVPGMSRFGRGFSNFWYRVQTGFPIGDAQSGFRAYPLAVLEHLKLSESRFSFEVEVLVKAAWAGVKVQDIDVDVFYPPKEKRVSHFKLIRDNARLTHLNILLTLRSFLPVPHKKMPGMGKALKFSIFKPVQSIRLFLSHEVTPFSIAMSGALGVLLGTLPLFAAHTLAILVAAGFFRLNKVVAVGFSQFCMPPFVPALCIETGYFLTHKGTFLTEISFQTLGYQAVDRLLEWVIGSFILAPLLAVAAFAVVYPAASIMAVKEKA